LLVDDDRVDAMTVERALRELKVTNRIVHSINGEDALKYLRSNGNSKPCIILLDLNMPKMNGIEFLRVIKSSGILKRIPVVVLTTSRDKQDIVESFKLNAAGFMVKPVDSKKCVELLRESDLYWTSSELPDGS